MMKLAANGRPESSQLPDQSSQNGQKFHCATPHKMRSLWLFGFKGLRGGSFSSLASVREKSPPDIHSFSDCAINKFWKKDDKISTAQFLAVAAWAAAALGKWRRKERRRFPLAET